LGPYSSADEPCTPTGSRFERASNHIRSQPGLRLPRPPKSARGLPPHTGNRMQVAAPPQSRAARLDISADLHLLVAPSEKNQSVLRIEAHGVAGSVPTVVSITIDSPRDEPFGGLSLVVDIALCDLGAAEPELADFAGLNDVFRVAQRNRRGLRKRGAERHRAKLAIGVLPVLMSGDRDCRFGRPVKVQDSRVRRRARPLRCDAGWQGFPAKQAQAEIRKRSVLKSLQPFGEADDRGD
jgi:hypothetical protein